MSYGVEELMLGKIPQVVLEDLALVKKPGLRKRALLSPRRPSKGTTAADMVLSGGYVWTTPFE